MYKLNKKGFTLVELLAVIVVLAIIIVIAAPAIINAMNDAKKGTFKVYAQKVLNQAQARYQNDTLLGLKASDATKRTVLTGGGVCYDLAQIGITTKGNYAGVVYVSLNVSAVPTYYITITDNSFNVTDATYENLDDANNITPSPLIPDPVCNPAWTPPTP